MSEAFPGGITAPLDWINAIAPAAPNVPLDHIKYLILTKLRYFFQRSQCWREWVGPITLHPTISGYSVELTDFKAELISTLAGYRLSDGFPLTAVSSSDPAADQMINEDEIGDPLYFFQTPSTQLQIFPTIPEGSTNQVKFFCSMMPIDLCHPDWIKERFFDAIKCGVLGDIYLSPGVNYKPDLGVRMEKRYRSMMSNAARDAIASHTNIREQVITPFRFLGVNLQGRFSHGSSRGGSGRYW